jgi:GLPGLI family protein
MKEEANTLNWQLSSETKKIGDFLCKKATVFFRGRNYTAWYTTKIAIPYGPWKLHGLPGLIVEAYDTDKKVFWYFKNAEYPSDTKQNVTFIKKSKGEKTIQFVDYQSFKKFKLERQEEAIAINRMNQKNFKGIVFVDPKISEMFVEFE